MPRLTEMIIGCAMKVHTTLGPGFLEKVYENALVHELKKAALHVEQQVSIKVFYDGIVVGAYVADLIVEEKIILELKAITGLPEDFTAVCVNYLSTTKMPVCLLMNFGKRRLEWKRLVGESYEGDTEPL